MNLWLSGITVTLLLAMCSCGQKTQIADGHGDNVLVENLLNSGDIVCRYGHGLWSQLFRDVSSKDKRFSHVGIVVIESGYPFVVHASADDYSGRGQVDKEPFSIFVSNATDFAVYRVKGHDDIGHQIASNALTYIGKPFDIRFDLKTTNEVYCSQLVRLCVNSAVGKEIVTTSQMNGKTIVAIDDCYLHPAVATVYDRTQVEQTRGANALTRVAHE